MLQKTLYSAYPTVCYQTVLGCKAACHRAVPCHHMPFASQRNIAQMDMHQLTKNKPSIQKSGNALLSASATHINSDYCAYKVLYENYCEVFAYATACYFFRMASDPAHEKRSRAHRVRSNSVTLHPVLGLGSPVSLLWTLKKASLAEVRVDKCQTKPMKYH